MPTAADITLNETLDLLDGDFAEVAKAICEGGYAFWLGSGISRDGVIGLDGVLLKLIEFLRVRVTAVPGCAYRAAFDRIIGLANPSAAERAQIDLGAPADTWTCIRDLLARLWGQYSEVFETRIVGKAADYLLWDGLEFAKTFGSEKPDAEHLAVAILTLEGAVTHVATPNWDGLLEAALEELGHGDEVFRITVTGDDLREAKAAPATLYKFHGCARLAIADEARYRQLLVVRAGQIARWNDNDTFTLARDQLMAVIQRMRSLVIGLSAQDINIQRLFSEVAGGKRWHHADRLTPIVISAEELGDDHKRLLEVSYGADFEANRPAILLAARLRAFAKPLLLALVLYVLTEKLKALAGDAGAPHLDAAELSEISEGLTHLRDRVAVAGNADRPTLIRAIAGGLARARHQLQDGVSAIGKPSYYPLDTQPPGLMKGKQALAVTGQREAAAALGLIGLDVAASTWTAAIDDPSLADTGALRLSSVGATARVFLAANDDVVGGLLDAGAFREDDGDVVVICSRKVTERQQRSPIARLRTGAPGPRYVSFGPMLAKAAGLEDLRDAFRKEVAI